MQSVLSIAFVCCWLGGFIWMLSYVRFLKKQHPEIHAEIFRDSFQKKALNDWRLFMFLVRAEYRNRASPNFVQQSDFLRYYLLFLFLLMTALIASTIML